MGHSKNETDFYTKQSLDKSLLRMRYNRVGTQLTSINLIAMMSSDESVKGELDFYVRIIDELLTGDMEKISYPEKEQFLILHKAMVETYNELSN